MNKLEEIKKHLDLLEDLYIVSECHKDIEWLIKRVEELEDYQSGKSLWKKRALKAEKRVEELEENIKLIHKEYGCELRDPNGTIWDHASELQEKVSKYETAFKLAQKALQEGK